MDHIASFAASTPHADAIFSLLPINPLACSVLSHLNNRQLVSAVGAPSEGKYGLNIGPHLPAKSRYTLATLGRNSDIVVEGRHISRIQCSFEVHETTGAIMLQDRSTRDTTRTTGESAIPFEPGRRPRRVLVTPQINLEFELGETAQNLFRFQIIWHQSAPTISDVLQRRIDFPRDARTIDEAQTTLPSHPLTRIHAATSQNQKIRWVKKTNLGHGSSGEVWSALNIDSGDVFAVKIIKLPPSMEGYTSVKREVHMLSVVSHANIVEYIAAQDAGDRSFEIFTGLKDGNVEDLVHQGVFIRDQEGDALLRSMLEALVYLHARQIIHRDVKPANILFTRLGHAKGRTAYQYQLADFGISNFSTQAKTFTGSYGFTAPELHDNRRTDQTAKMDVWSLLVTLLYAMNHCEFRDMMRHRHSPISLIKMVQDAVIIGPFTKLRAMAEVEPQQRASALDILTEVYQGGIGSRARPDASAKRNMTAQEDDGEGETRSLQQEKPRKGQPARVPAEDDGANRRVTRGAAKRAKS